MVTAGASGDRMNAALGAGVLEPAIDAAMAAQARNSIEKMLCHHLAAARYTAMRLIERSTQPNLQAGEVARFTNASARMMDVYQAGCLALLKLKTRGQQRVLVQYVNVGAGGQAVVAGRVEPRGDPSKARRCGARTRRGTACHCPDSTGHQALIFLILVSMPPALMVTFTASSIGSLKGTSMRSRPCS